MRYDFYASVKHIDELRAMSEPKGKAVNESLKLCSDIRQYRYFFHDLENSAWVKPKRFATFLHHRLSASDRSQSWYVAKYLARVAEKASPQVRGILHGTKPKDYRTVYSILEAAVFLRPHDAARLTQLWSKLIPRNDIGREEPYIKLVKSFLENGHYSQGLELVRGFTIPRAKPKPDIKVLGVSRLVDAEPVVDSHSLGQFVSGTIPILREKVPFESCLLFERQLKRCFHIEQSKRKRKHKEDFSYIWRPAIEEHEQNFQFGQIKEVLAVALRDSMEALAHSENHEKALTVLTRYTKSDYSIFRRLALHTLRVEFQKFEALVENVARDKRYFDDHTTRHEYALLLKEHFGKFSHTTRDRILQWIDIGPDREAYERWLREAREQKPTKEHVDEYVDRWRLEKLWVIRNYLPEQADKIDELKNKFEEPKLAEFPTYHEEGPIGYRSSISVEQLLLESDDQIVDRLRNPIPMDDPFDPYEGFGGIFQSAVTQRPDRFLPFALRLMDGQVKLQFIKHYFYALRDIAKNNPGTLADEVLRLARYVSGLSITETQATAIRPDARRSSLSSVKAAIADYFETVMRDRKGDITMPRMDEVRDILFLMVGDEDPSPEDERKFGEPNNDWATMSLNTTSGKALHAILQYSLRYAKMNEGKGPKLEQEVREKLTEVIENDKRRSVYAVFGMYLANLWYLDANWAKSLLPALFVQKNEPLWRATWDSYISFNGLYKDIYTELKPHYKMAITLLSEKKTRRVSHDRLAQHVSLVYWRGYEELTDTGSLLRRFYRVASSEQRVSLVRQFGQGLRGLKIAGKIASTDDTWLRAKRLWQWRVERVHKWKDRKAVAPEIATFSEWLPDVPEDPKVLYPLINETLQFMLEDFRSGFIMDYLTTNVALFTFECVSLLKTLTEIARKKQQPFPFDHREVKKILDESLAKGGDASLVARDVANMFGEIGNFSYQYVWKDVTERENKQSSQE